MNLEQQILYLNESYKIISIENEFMIHPTAFGILPLTSESLQYPFACTFHIDDYSLLLDNLTLYKVKTSTTDVEQIDNSGEQYTFQYQPITFNGAILIGDTPIKEYTIAGCNQTCFSYKNVYELIFENGYLITTIDQSKAMLRIRKNIELRLRSLTNKRDIRCITHFIKSSFVGDYRLVTSTKKRLRYLEDMKSIYQYYDQISSI